MSSPLISPSLLSADFGNLNSEIDKINKSSAEYFHLDIMDGIFVPNISFGFPVIKAIKAKAEKPLDVHLMIEQPDRYFAEFKSAGADILTVQYEACTHLHRSLQGIRTHGMKTGVALNPHTPVALLEHVITDIDLLLIMSVNPGYGGQSFIEETYTKIQTAIELREKKSASFIISIDGGVIGSNAQQLSKAGADMLVSGSFLFKADDFEAAVCELKGIHKN